MTKQYKIIVADPPWSYENKATRASADKHYPTMTMTDMMNMKVKDISDPKGSVLCMWYTSNSAYAAQLLAESWGFKVKTHKFITWVKMNKLYKDHIQKALNKASKEGNKPFDADDFMNLMLNQTRMGIGNYTRANTEDMLIATRGKILPRLNRVTKQVIYAPIGSHSAKPQEVMSLIVDLFGDLDRLEMFSRRPTEGWDAWGNEAENNVMLDLISKDDDHE